jgi:outer membrane protein assembly factor BamE
MMPPLQLKWKSNPMRFLIISLLLSALSACGNLGFPGVYRIDVEQGNIVTQEMVDQLKPGMNRNQVRFVLGTPLLEDSFHQNRWDYIFLIRNGNTSKKSERLSVFFDGDELSHFTGSFVPTEPTTESDS